MSYEPSQVTPPPIVVSLEDWEKKLLESFDASFPGDTEELAGEPGSTFEAWFWVRKLRSDIESVIEGRNTTSRLSNSTVWELVKRWLSRRGDSIGEQYSCVSRLARLEKDNQGLRTWLTSAGQEPDFTAESVSIRPQEDDRRYWAIAVRALHCLPPSWRGVAPDEPLHRKFGFYEISNTHDTSNFDGPVVRVLHVPLEPEMTQAAEPSSEPPTTHHESDESRAATGQGHGGSGNTTPALDTTEESEAGQHSDSNQLSGLSSLLESERYHVWADDNEPMALSYSHADYRATRASLMSKLKLSEEAPTPESALQRVLDKLALLVLVRDESGGQAMEDREGGEEAVAGSALGVSKSDSTHLFYRMFEIWDLSRMAASVRRRQLREAALAGDPKTEASPLLVCVPLSTSQLDFCLQNELKSN